jgi:curved DNA-binding protein
MEFEGSYATLGVERSAMQDEIERACRELARKFHPDVSKEPDAEARFKAIAEAHEALIGATTLPGLFMALLSLFTNRWVRT